MMEVQIAPAYVNSKEPSLSNHQNNQVYQGFFSHCILNTKASQILALLQFLSAPKKLYAQTMGDHEESKLLLSFINTAVFPITHSSLY